MSSPRGSINVMESLREHVQSISSLPTKTSRLTWPDLPSSSRYIRRNGWEHRPIPEELTKLPEDLLVPEILQQIITWSLVPGSNWSFPPQKKEIDRKSSQIQKNDLQETEIQSLSSISTHGIDTPSSSTDNASTSSFHTSVSQNSASCSGQAVASEKSPKARLFSKAWLNKLHERSMTSTRPKSPIPTPESVPKIATAECTSCFEDLPEVEMTRLTSCPHWYCKECLSTLITTAMASETSFPPKCCLSPISLQQILKALSAKQREEYQLKAAEYAVAITDRWYCPNKDCLKWIPGSQLKINQQLGYDCPHCAAKLCRTCRGPAHPANTECPQDFGLEATLETAEVEGWQRCYKCRALVEHNTGCRHMTCRCKAQFCYVCGLRWQTCQCTETDASNKRAGAQRRRQEMAAKVDAEAAEIARAIAEVEEMERREAEERRLEEEEQLRRLEALRQEEEARKQEQADQAERDFHEVMIKSFAEEWNQLEQILCKVRTLQCTAINSRHEADDNKLGCFHLKDEKNVKHESDLMSQILLKNITKRRNRLTAKQKKDLDALSIRQEEQEDRVFIQIQLQLQGKANKESRMERMLAQIRDSQDEEKQVLQEKHQTETEELEKKIKLDTEGVRRWCEVRLQAAHERQQAAVQKFGYVVGADRQYYEIVFERRSKMLARHGESSLASLEMGQSATALTEFEASKIEPYLPELDAGSPGPSGISRGPKIIMTPHGPLKMDRPTAQSSSQRSSREYQEEKIVNPIPRESQDMYNGSQAPLHHRISQPPIPGSYPIDVTSNPRPHSGSYPLAPTPSSLVPQPLQKRAPIIPFSLAPPVPPKAPGRFDTSTNTNTNVNVNMNTNTNTNTNTSTIRSTRHSGPPTLSATTMASLAAGMALGVAAQPKFNSSERKQDIKVAVSPISALEPDVSPLSPRDPWNTDSSSHDMRKSKWPFKKNNREMSEDEFKRRLSATVGDGFGANMTIGRGSASFLKI